MARCIKEKKQKIVIHGIEEGKNVETRVGLIMKEGTWFYEGSKGLRMSEI